MLTRMVWCRSNPIQDALERTEQQLECLLGDTLVAAALVTYSGHLDLRGRSSFIEVRPRPEYFLLRL